MKVKRFGFLGLVCLGLLLGSCSNDADKEVTGGGEQPSWVTARVADFEGTNHILEGENEITDMKAFLFQGGVLTKVYEGLQPSDGGYNLKLDRYEGKLYMVANAEGAADLDLQSEGGITEAEWLKKTIAMKDGKPANFFTGSLALAPSAGASAQTLTLKRGQVRFDLEVEVAGKASVNSLTLKNAAQTAFLFPQEGGAYSPEDTSRKDASVSFSEPLTSGKQGVLYVYEQANNGLQLSINVSYDGQPAKEITKAISETVLQRNKVYKVVVRKDDIDIKVNVGFEGWEQGGDIEIPLGF